jgi:tetratricopeptide (TPR) repeat protein
VVDADHEKAGWCAYHCGFIHSLRKQADAVLTCAGRAAEHWDDAEANPRERSIAIALRGRGHLLKENYPAAVTAYREVFELHRSLTAESDDVAISLNDLATAEKDAGNFPAAEEHYREALRVARAVDYAEGIAYVTGNLAGLALVRRDWPTAEILAREALPLSEAVHRQELVAYDCLRLALALLQQEKAAEALPHAQRAVEIDTRLIHPDLEAARRILTQCRAAILSGLHPDWTYNSTTLEGNTLTKAEVAEALAKPKAKIAKRPAEHVAAVRAQQAAIQALGRWLGEDRPFTTDDLFSLHTVLMQGSTVDSMKPIGAWKIEDNGTPIRPGGKSRWNDNYATAQHTGALMETWLTEFNKRREGAGEPFEDYLWLHATFVRIHPFADGNGRLARLLANVPLVASGQPVVDIPATARDRYLAALARWQFACGAPRPNAPLYSKAGELKDFIALCKASQATARNPAADGTPRRKPKAPRRRKSPPR